MTFTITPAHFSETVRPKKNMREAMKSVNILHRKTVFEVDLRKFLELTLGIDIVIAFATEVNLRPCRGVDATSPHKFF